jgi:hypothetical protein
MPNDYALGRNQRALLVIEMMPPMLIAEFGRQPPSLAESALAQMSVHLGQSVLLR